MAAGRPATGIRMADLHRFSIKFKNLQAPVEHNPGLESVSLTGSTDIAARGDAAGSPTDPHCLNMLF